jgi:hypothetical protein
VSFKNHRISMGAIGCRCTDDVDTTCAEATAENDVAPGTAQESLGIFHGFIAWIP